MTSFHLLPPFHQPAFVRRVASRAASYLQNATHLLAVPTDRINWNEVSSNIIATVLGGALLALSGGILYIAWQVPRQQDQILAAQVEIKQAMRDLTIRIDRIEMNDRRQDERIIRQEHRSP
jgi:hypothetical protein